MKLIFFGSDNFSIKALEACLDSDFEIARVITTPPKKKGRGLKLIPSEIETFAKEKNLPLAAYQSLKDPQIASDIKELNPDVFVVASYGKIIPVNLLEIPKFRLNVHPSLLPKYRGSAPINWPILNGDSETGVSIIDIAAKLDSGEIYLQEKVSLSEDIDALELNNKLAELGYELLKKALNLAAAGNLKGIAQDDARATVARQLEKSDGEIKFLHMNATEIVRKVRGLKPWPGTFFYWGKERVAILNAEVVAVDGIANKPGVILSLDSEGFTLSALSNAVRVTKVKPEGKNAMSGAEFAHGRRIIAGTNIS